MAKQKDSHRGNTHGGAGKDVQAVAAAVIREARNGSGIITQNCTVRIAVLNSGHRAVLKSNPDGVVREINATCKGWGFEARKDRGDIKFAKIEKQVAAAVS